MKKVFSSFGSFSRKERIGILALSVLMVAFLAVRFTMRYWVTPNRNDKQDKRLIQAVDVYKRSQPKKTADGKSLQYINAASRYADVPDKINLNTADSATLVLLKGVGPVTAHKIIAWRKAQGPFTNIDQLRPLGRFSDENFEMLKKHLVLSSD